MEDCASLIEIGADINWTNGDGDTPLLAACRRGHRDTISLLLAHGADTNICGSDSNSPLHVCVRRGDYESVAALLDANSSTSLKTKDGQTALDIAKAKGFEQIYGVLMRPRRVINGTFNNSSIPNISVDTRKADLPPLETVSSGRSKKNLTINRIIESVLKDDLYNNNPAPSAASESNARPAMTQPQDSKKAKLEGLQPPMPKEVASTSSSSVKYSMIGQQPLPSSLNMQEELINALKKQLDDERKIRKQLDAKLEAFRAQNTELLSELTHLTQEVCDMREEKLLLTSKLERLQVTERVRTTLTIEDCTELENELRNALQVVEEHKAALVKDALESQKEMRLCVICQEKEKSVVLLPCRHMCLCALCANHDQLRSCPLCRKDIEHKISVFS